MRPKSAIYTPKKDDEHPHCYFYMGDPLPLVAAGENFQVPALNDSLADGYKMSDDSWQFLSEILCSKRVERLPPSYGYIPLLLGILLA